MKLKKDLQCEQHGLEKKYFCAALDCQKAICPECYFEGHHGHEKKLLKDVFEERKLEFETKICEEITFLEAQESFSVSETKKVQKEREERTKINKNFFQLMTKANEKYCFGRLEEIEQWTATQIRSRIKERRELKLKMKASKMVEFIEQAPKVLDSTSTADWQLETPKFDLQEDDDYVTGHYIFYDYAQRRVDSKESYFSDPILAEGVSYMLEFCPNGWGDSREIQISLGMVRTKPACLNLDTDDRVFYIINMLHSKDRAWDISRETTDDWTGEDDYSFMATEFYKIADLAKDGFIHEDGSLRFDFKIKKHNFQKIAMEAEA